MFAVVAVLVGCGNDPSEQGGAGTDAGNALTVLARATDGSAVPGASVEVRSASQIPDSGSAAAFTAQTGADGSAVLHLPPGSWSVLVRHGALVSWNNQVGATGRITSLLDSMAYLQGTFRGAGGMRIAFRGLGLSTRCDTMGIFYLDSLPPGLLPMVVVHGDGRFDSTLVPLSGGSRVSISGATDSLPGLMDTTTVLNQPQRPSFPSSS